MACIAHALYHIAICDLSGSTIFFHIISYTASFLGGGVTEHKMCVLAFSSTFVRNISHFKKNSVRNYHKCTLAFMYGTVILVTL